MRHIGIIIPILSLLFVYKTTCLPKTDEQRLLDYLFANKSAAARPVVNASSAVEVKFGIELVQLQNLDEKQQSITTKLWVRQVWHSELMKWDPKEWGGVTQLTVEPDQIWKPDIVLYNNAEETYGGGTEKYKTLVTLYPDGTQTWFSPTTFKSTCKINVADFPFDTQHCNMKFGSWSYDSSKLNLSRHYAPLLSGQYLNSSIWEILDIVVAFKSVKYNCCPNQYQDLTFTFVFKRYPLYYVFNVIGPCIVLVSMVLVSFWLPAESGERLSLNITVLLSLAVFLQFLSDTLPRNSDSTPIISKFFITMMAESGVALMATVIVLATHHRGEGKNASAPPSWTRKLFLHLNFNDIRFKQLEPIRARHGERDLVAMEGVLNKSGSLLTDSFRLIRGSDEALQVKSPTLCKEESRVTVALQEIARKVEKISRSMESQEKQDFITQEWKQLAKDLDSLFFFLFLMVFVVSGIGSLLQVYDHFPHA